jgi:ParB-like chromosome segregation protein Spo0J
MVDRVAKKSGRPYMPMVGAVEDVPVKAIKLYDQNPRTNQPVDLVADSIKEFGFTQPLVIDEKFVIIAGHTRYKAACQLGYEYVPCVQALGWTDEQIRRYRLLDNTSSEIADWDEAFLKIELADLEADGCDITSLGFEDDFLNQVLEREIKKLDAAQAEGDPDEVDDANDVELTAGDVLELGTHQLVCGYENMTLIIKILAYCRKNWPNMTITRNGEAFTVPDVT